MYIYHIHISGLVQGVGFRPHVHRLALQMNIDGWVSNGTDGVNIMCKGDSIKIENFYKTLIQTPPLNAIIISHSIKNTNGILDDGFFINESTNTQSISMLIAPDITLCEECRQELNDSTNNRFQYPFITCVNCGPRYSIQTATPYDRPTTTMQAFEMCDSCKTEYDNVLDKRHHSQTNSCPTCAITMHLYHADGQEINILQEEVIAQVCQLLSAGKILAIKGTGGYLLVADATQAEVVSLLRKRKNRPKKPFALLYANLEMVKKDVFVRECEQKALIASAAPIVLCKLKSDTLLCSQEIAPNLQKLGVMLPNSALLQLIADQFGKPLIATSANISGSPIIYKDVDTLTFLGEIADYILSYDREIVAPQDDSVMQFSEREQKIILRRSRGLAPNYYPLPDANLPNNVLAMGADLKSTFAISNGEQLFVSQYLGNQESIDSQESFDAALSHVQKLLRFSPKHILADKHPLYFVSQKASEMAISNNCTLTLVQHHEAHFMSVLAENRLLSENKPILGIIWDGAGYGNDKQIWGGETFVYENKNINRVAHLQYFPQLLGDKMSREPRLSALSLLSKLPNKQHFIEKYFTDKEWFFYQQLAKQLQSVSTSSMGRLIDGVACLLGIKTHNSFEGEAAMLLETLARNSPQKTNDFYEISIENGLINWQNMIEQMVEENTQIEEKSLIAYKFFNSLAKLIGKISVYFNINDIAFSGGVFQNALLVDLIIEQLSETKTLYFHQQLSPNDECISFGQLAWFNLKS